MKYLNIKKALAAWQNIQPLSEKDRDRLSRRFTVDFNYNSNHIEGILGQLGDYFLTSIINKIELGSNIQSTLNVGAFANLLTKVEGK